ncbi:PKD domain-containing protein [Marinoscillum pacificum]|uniref:PKD domain-containing protein n=1 Tax=Marinoscillum pacificum TaxID=392723 RepID=UPI00280BDF06|nr:PKD domain-containing protein [Marinoscillum pacificum]
MIVKNSLFILLILLGFLSEAQESRKGTPVICPAITKPNDFKLLSRIPHNTRSAQGQSANGIFEVEYIGFSDEAQIAFQYAVDIWESILKSDVKIRVKATWEPLESGVLGAAGATTYFRDFENAPESNTWYPIPLAEKIAGIDLNGEDEFDIEASFNSSFSNWYLGTDGQGSGQYDLVSVVLHELGHGLGFISGEDYDDTDDTGRWDLQETGFPMIFTKYLEDGVGTNIISLPNGSTEIGSFLTSADVYVSSELVNSANSGPARVYAPSNYDLGSSISHWDESTFNNTANALMTPAVAPSEVIHDPGIITLGFFADMGWFRTDIDHSPLLVADVNSPLNFKVTLASDTTLITDDFVVNVYYDGGDTVAYNLAEVSSGVFTVNVSPDATKSSLNYYFDGLSDALSKSYRVPEIGSYEVTLTSLSSINPPFTTSDGGDFTSDAAGFIASSNISGQGLWELGIPVDKFENYSSQAWVTGLSNTIVSPNQSIESALVSPVFDLSDESKDYVLSFDYLGEFSEFDYAGVFFSLDSGVTWSKLGNANDGLGESWYQSIAYGDFFGVDTKDSDDSYELKTASYPLYGIVGNSVMIKISYFLLSGGQNSEYGNEGVLIDNFQILASDPTARFYSADTTFNFPNQEIEFFYASSGATSYLWNFGDGTTSDVQNPIHIYDQGGSFDISLTVNYPNGSSSFTRENYITVISQKGSTYQLSDGGNFESSTSDFIAVNLAGTGFELGNSDVPGKDGTNSGDLAWVTGLAEGNYANNSEAYLYTPEFDFAIIGDYEMSFFAKYSFENLWDGFIVEYTTDRGQTWTKLDEQVREEWYDDLSDPNAIFGNGVPIFTGISDGFEQKKVDVSFLSGSNHVSFRFVFLTDPAEVDAGMAIDDFELIGPGLGEIAPAFSSELTSGNSGCSGVAYTFYNESEGAIYDLSWYFGESASPVQASGPGPHIVEFVDAGSYNVVLTAADQSLNTISVDTTFSVSPTHEPIVTQSGSGPTVDLSLSAGDSYQWFLDNEVLTEEIGQTIKASKSGTYSGAVTIGECTMTTSGIYIVAAEEEANMIELYPNPAYDVLNVHMYERIKSVHLIELSGSVIASWSVPDGARSLSLSDHWKKCSSGTYVLSFTTYEGDVLSYKVIKK